MSAEDSEKTDPQREVLPPADRVKITPTDAATVVPSAEDVAKAEAGRTNKSSGSLSDYVDKPSARSMEILAVDKDGKPVTISRESAIKGKDLDTETAKKNLLKSGDGLNFHDGVSPSFKARVEGFWNSVPAEIRKRAIDCGIRVVVVNEAKQIVPNASTANARRHAEGEMLSQQPGFYYPPLRAVVLVEHPDPTPAELAARAKLEEQGIKYLGHFKERSFEETAWHEFGHGLDFVLLKHISTSKPFDDAFKKGLSRVTEADRRQWRYYVTPDGTSYTAAKEELFAQLFWLRHKGESRQTDADKRMLANFAEVVAIHENNKL